jgi:uncharacterized metal-binding protein YceD (DUF177 family)
VDKPSFVVKLADLERDAKEVTFALSEDWLRKALSDAQAEPLEPGEATVELMKNDHVVLVRGHARAKVTVPCVVTLDPVPLDLRPEIFLELEREPEPPRVRPGAKTEPRAAVGKSADTKKSAKRGSERHPKRGKEEPELSAEEAAHDTFKGEEIALDGFIREFILLEIPPYPRRSDLPSPEESISSRPLADPDVEAKTLDPRLAPLLGIANRLKGSVK